MKCRVSQDEINFDCNEVKSVNNHDINRDLSREIKGCLEVTFDQFLELNESQKRQLTGF